MSENAPVPREKREPLPVRPMAATDADLELFSECFANNTTARDPSIVRWQYRDNPTGALFVDFALAPSGKTAAIYATLPVRMRIRGEVVLAMQSVDTITDSEFRGRGLFLQLARTTYERAAQSGVKLVYGFPNGSSAHGFFQRLEWKQLDPIPFLIRPLRTRYLVDRLKLGRFARLVPDVPLPVGIRRRDPNILPLARFDERATHLWHAFSRGIDVAVERDASYLNWRLVEKPSVDYRNAQYVDKGELAAFVSHTVKPKHGGNIGYIMEALCAPGGERPLRRLLGRALRDMVHEGADIALAWCMPHSPNYSTYLRMGFVPFPERMRPIELHFGVRSFASELADTVVNRRSWYLSYVDSDTA